MQKLGRKVSTTEKDTEKRALGREMETKRKGKKKYFKIRATEKKDRERIKTHTLREQWQKLQRWGAKRREKLRQRK